MRIILNDIEVIQNNNTIEINSANPFFSNEEDRLDNIFSINIPVTGNEKALKYAQNIDTIVGNEFTCEIISDINFLGIAIITEVSRENNSATLQIGYAKSNFNYLIKDKMMKEIDYGEIVCADKIKIQTTSWAQTFVSEIDDVTRYLLSFSYKSGNSNYFRDGYLYISEAVNIKINIRAFIYYIYPGFPSQNRTKIYYQKNTASPILLIDSGTIVWEDKNIDLITTFSISGAVGDVIRIYIDGSSSINLLVPLAIMDCTIFNKDLVISSNSNPDSNICFPLIKNNNMMGQLPTCASQVFYNDKYPLVNMIGSTSTSYQVSYNGLSYTKPLAACLKVSFILSKLFNSIGYNLDKTKFGEIYSKLIVFTGSIIADYTSNTSSFFLDLPEKYSLSSCFDNEVLISDFLKDLYNITGFFPIFDHEAKSAKLVSVNDIFNNITKVDINIIDDTINYNNEEKGISISIENGEDQFLSENYNNLEDYNVKGSVATISDLPLDAELNDCYYITSERKYYTYYFGHKEDETTNSLFWKFISCDYRLHGEQGEETFVEFTSKTPIMVGTTTSVVGNGTTVFQDLKIPVTEQPIRINKAYETYNNKYSNSFLLSIGLKTQTGIGDYLYASADNYYGNEKFSGISLRVDGDDGIMERIYKNLVKIYSEGKRHTITGYIKSSEIRKLTYENLIEIDNCVNLLLSYNYKLTENELMEVELELIKI